MRSVWRWKTGRGVTGVGELRKKNLKKCEFDWVQEELNETDRRR